MLPFDFSTSFDAPLVPQPDDWPVFDTVTTELAPMPIPPTRTSARNKNPNHIPRPRNAFMLFRSAFAAAQKITTKIEHDNRHITRIIAHCWNRLSDEDKQIWRDKAAAEKALHAERYPGYRFSPIGRTSRPVKRNVRRNGADDVKRCEKLAELVMAGKCGQELESAIMQIDSERGSATANRDVSVSPKTGWTDTQDAEPSSVALFRSPLLPPVASQQDHEPMPQPLPRVPTPHHVEPQAFYSDLPSLFGPMHFEYQPLDAVTDSHQAESAPCALGLDLRLFSWNPSDSFSYYNC